MQEHDLGEGWSVMMHKDGTATFCNRDGRATVSTNALARARHKCRETDTKDVDGNSLRVGDTVQAIEYGPNAIHRLVKAIGTGEHLAGYIMVTSSIAWKSARQFRKVK